MNYLAELKDEGRIEVLRENRNHFHVFAFVDGKRPDETFVRDSLGNVRAGKVTQSTETEGKAVKKAEKSGRRARS